MSDYDHWELDCVISRLFMHVQCTYVHVQVSARERATVESLLNHPWAIKGYDKPVDWTSRIDVCMLYRFLSHKNVYRVWCHRWTVWIWTAYWRWPITTRGVWMKYHKTYCRYVYCCQDVLLCTYLVELYSHELVMVWLYSSLDVLIFLWQWNYDNVSATYLLLLQQKLCGRRPEILMWALHNS